MASTLTPVAADSAKGLSLDRLRTGANKLADLPAKDLLTLLEVCLKQTYEVSSEWVQAGIKQKHLVEPASQAEEILAGPAALMRGLVLLRHCYRSLVKQQKVPLPGKIRIGLDGRTYVPLMPVNAIYDSVIFSGMSCQARMQAGIGPEQIHGELVENILHPHHMTAKIVLILGAGNVSSIAPADAISKIFLERKAVLLKLNPVNNYLRPIYERAFRSLIEADILELIEGDGQAGQLLIDHPEMDEVHITGSHHTHEAIVWGATPTERAVNKRNLQPALSKPITSELGNVSPWIVVPGRYSKRELKSQATHLAASIINNASFNCVATKMIVTSANWPQRQQFLDLLEGIFRATPARNAYYPGAVERYEQFVPAEMRPTTEYCDTQQLPWTLLRDLNPESSPIHFDEESFVCVCGETALSAETPAKFLAQATEFCNTKLFGTLAANLTLPTGFEKQHRSELDHSLAELRYGAIGINQWAGLVYGMMSPPWGGYPNATLENPQSGIGTVHNTLMLQGVEKSILRGPLCSFPKPLWFPTHRTALQVARELTKLYANPNLLQLSKLGWYAAQG